jgi:hypothetical protein
MQNIRIEEFHIEKKWTKVNSNFEETRKGITQIIKSKLKLKFIPHDDLKECLDKLKIHFASLTETIQIPNKAQSMEECRENFNLDHIKISGIKITRKGETYGVNIIGSRVLKDERTVNFETPFTNFDPSISDYQFVEELQEDVEALEGEIIQYINGKFSIEGTQLSLQDTPSVAA